MDGLAIGLLLLVHWLGEPLRHAYEARVEALRAAGQPARHEDLATPRVSDEENAAVLLAEATAFLRQRESPHPYLDPAEAGPEQIEEMRAYLESLKPYFEMLAEVPKRPRWHVDREWAKGPEARFDEIWWLQEAMHHLSLRVDLDADEKGRTRRAAEAAVLALDLGERCRIPMVIGHLVSETVICYPARFLRGASRQQGFDAAEFRRIVDPRLARAPGTGPLAEALGQERVVVLWTVDALRSGRKTILDDYLPMKGVLHRSPGWRLLLYRDANRALDLFEEAIELAGKPSEEVLRDATLLRERCATKDPTCLVTQLTAAVLPRLLEVHVKRVATQRLTRVVMALLEHRQTKGAWPHGLDAMGEMPLDPFSGLPFLYERTDTGVRIRAAKRVRAQEGADWEPLEEENLAWTFDD